jgi:phosphatidylglycerol:prolipoprotein diacylglycerol transferase
MPNSFTIPFPIIGALTIHFYGIIIMIGALAAAWLASVEARRRSLNSDIVWDALLWVLLGGIIGARLWHIFTPPPSMIEMGITTRFYLTHPLEILAIWHGGLGVPGAVLGGGLALYLYCRKKKLNFLVWADIAAPAVALGQAIGRWGNFVNQELYGRPTTLPWGIQIDYQTGYPASTRFHPLFLYESIYSLLNMALLLWLGRRYNDKLLPGDLFLIYLITYPLGRFLLEFLRLDAAELGGININQTIMLVVAIVSASTIIIRHQRQKAKTIPTSPESVEVDHG